MPDFLDRTVIDRTTIENRYAESASWQSMDRYLADWHRAQHRLNRQIAHLTSLRDERRDAAERGEWPPSPPKPPPPAENHVVDLMAALEQSVERARAAREYGRGESR